MKVTHEIHVGLLGYEKCISIIINIFRYSSVIHYADSGKRTFSYLAYNIVPLFLLLCLLLSLRMHFPSISSFTDLLLDLLNSLPITQDLLNLPL